MGGKDVIDFLNRFREKHWVDKELIPAHLDCNVRYLLNDETFFLVAEVADYSPEDWQKRGLPQTLTV